MSSTRPRLIAAFLFAAIFARAVFAAPPAGYYLVWSDEFNGSSLDTSKWGYRLPGAYRNGFNTPSAVSLNGSNLVITTYSSGGTNFTSMLYSKGKFESKYGYWESNAKWSDSNAVWSSFWMLSPSYSFSASSLADLAEPQVAGSELDICEHRYVDGSNTNNIANQIEVNLHWYAGSTTEVNSPGSGNVGSGLAAGFHTYGFLWTSNSYSFSVDGSQVYNGGSAPVSQSTEYALLTSAVDDTSTTWAGFIPANGYGSQSTSATKFTVDYVRYYAPTNVLFWTGANSTLWNNTANWLSNMPPQSSSDLTFSYLSGSALSTTLGQDYNINGLSIISTSGNVTVGGANTLTLGAGGIDAIAANHTVTINTPVNVSAAQTWGIGLNSSHNAANTMTMNGSISGAGTLTKSCYGTLILNTSDSFSGLVNVDTGSSSVNDGVLRVASANALSNAASPISIRNTGIGSSTFQLDPSSGSISLPQQIVLAGRNTNIAAIDSVTGSNSLAGGMSLVTGGSLYLVQCDAGTLNLGGTISATGFSAACVLTLQGAGNFVLSGSIQNGSSTALSLVKTNSGTLTISGVNTYTGTTTIERGSVAIAGSISGGMTIQSGCALSGNGTIGGATTVQSGGSLAPGISSGALTFGNSLTLNSGSSSTMQLNAALNTNAQIKVAALVSFSGTLNVQNISGALAPGQSFQLFSAGSYSGNFAATNLPALNTGLAWNTSALNQGILSVIATTVPKFQTITSSSGGVFTLSGTGAASQKYTLQTATNLAPPVAWISIGDTNADTTGAFQFTDSPNSNIITRFYRVMTTQ